MRVTVELYGIPRARAGVAETTADNETLGRLLTSLAVRFPALGDACIDGQTLKAGFTANLNGGRFVTDPSTMLSDGDSVLLMSMDAGG